MNFSTVATLDSAKIFSAPRTSAKPPYVGSLMAKSGCAACARSEYRQQQRKWHCCDPELHRDVQYVPETGPLL